MTEPVFRTAPYQQTLGTRVLGLTAEGGIVPEASNFYPTGGGQPGDSGHLVWQGGRIAIATIESADDITVRTLADGRHVSVLQHWSGRGPEARFLKEIHAAACRYFRVAIGPDFNAAHKDHFHYDRGFLSGR